MNVLIPNDNKDNIKEAINCLNAFTKNWCLDKTATKQNDDLIFRCSSCEFSTKDHYCLLKKFVHSHCSIYKDFGAMGDL